MKTLADIVAVGREREGTALAPPERANPYSYDEFSIGAWKAGNLLRHYGVHPGGSVAVVIGPTDPGADGLDQASRDAPGRVHTGADPLLATLGGTLVGSTVDLTPVSPVDARALVTPADWQDRYEIAAGCSRIAYGGPPEGLDVVHFARERWSENSVAPPETVSPEDDALAFDGERFTHGDLVDASIDIADEHGFDVDDAIGLDATLDTPGAVVAGVLAPLTAGATIVPVPADGELAAVETEVEVVVSRSATGSVPNIDPDAVTAALDTRRA